MLLIYEDILLACLLLGPQPGLLSFFGNDPVFVHVGGATQIHEAATEGADIVDVRVVKRGAVFAGPGIVEAAEVRWLDLP